MYIGGFIPYNKKRNIFDFGESNVFPELEKRHLTSHRCEEQMPFNYLNNKMNIVKNNRVIIKYKHFSFCFINTITFPFKRKRKASDINQIYPIYNCIIRICNCKHKNSPFVYKYLTGALFYAILNTDEGDFIK